jgi:hypothetical protein
MWQREHDEYKDIDGSPFVQDNWVGGEIFFDEGKNYIMDSLKFDIHKDALLFLFERKEYYIPEKIKIDKFSIGELEFIHLDKPEEGFYEIIMSRDKIELFKKYRCTLIEGKPYNGIVNGTNDKFKINSSYYARNGSGEIAKLVLTKSRILSLMSDKQKEVSNFIKENKLKLKKEKDLISIFNFYISLN